MCASLQALRLRFLKDPAQRASDRASRPGAPRDVLAGLLNGSSFNYVMIGTSSDHTAVASVILTAKPSSGDAQTAANVRTIRCRIAHASNGPGMPPNRFQPTASMRKMVFRSRASRQMYNRSPPMKIARTTSRIPQKTPLKIRPSPPNRCQCQCNANAQPQQPDPNQPNAGRRLRNRF